MRSLGLHYHLCANDTQIYMHSKPQERLDIAYLSDCITEIKIWMSSLNGGKTEVILIGFHHQISKAGSLSRTLDGSVL